MNIEIHGLENETDRVDCVHYVGMKIEPFVLHIPIGKAYYSQLAIHIDDDMRIALINALTSPRIVGAKTLSEL